MRIRDATENGLDCGGLLLVIGKELGLTELEHLGYSNSPDGETFERLLNENCDPVKNWREPQLADIIACDYNKGIQHCARCQSDRTSSHRYSRKASDRQGAGRGPRNERRYRAVSTRLRS
jgi:hypothetical protein